MLHTTRSLEERSPQLPSIKALSPKNITYITYSVKTLNSYFIFFYFYSLFNHTCVTSNLSATAVFLFFLNLFDSLLTFFLQVKKN